MGCCASCFYYEYQSPDDEYEQVHQEHVRRRMLDLYRTQYAREQAEGVVVLPVQTRVSYIDLEKVRAVFPPTPPRSPMITAREGAEL
jgi:hypothetical protein